LYSIHTLVGTIDTIASYNLELQGGDGVFITDTDYFSVGRASMDIVNFNAIIGLRFHRNVAENFPPVFVGQIYEGMRIPTNEGSYLDYFHDFTGICTNEIPLTSDDSDTTIPNETITICLLDNDIDPENKFDLNSLSFISTPPTSEGAVSLDVGTGCLTFVPNEDFTGDVTPFEYEICDAGKYIPAYKGDANALPVPTPVVDNPDILVTPSACNRATVYITVEDMATDITMASQDFDLNISPNPADEMLNISYTLPKKADVSIALWNVLGQPIKHLETETLQTGKYNKSFDVSHLSKGNYFIVLSVDGEVCSKNVKIK